MYSQFMIHGQKNIKLREVSFGLNMNGVVDSAVCSVATSRH